MASNLAKRPPCLNLTLPGTLITHHYDGNLTSRIDSIKVKEYTLVLFFRPNFARFAHPFKSDGHAPIDL